MKSNEMRYFLYARRSIEKKDDEEKVASVDSQISEMLKLAKIEGLKIVGTFQETKSAKEPGREQFNEMVKQLYQGKANGILVWKIDRLARNSIDEGTIKYLLQTGIVKHIRAHDKDWRPDDNALLASVEFGVATQYSRDLSKHVKRGLRALVEKGYRPNMAPIGYKNTNYHIKGSEGILVDEERFPIIRKLFDLMLTGAYTPVDLLRIANDQLGLRMRYGHRTDKRATRSNIYHVLTNTFYYGEFEYPVGSGEWYQGNHQPIITREEFDRVQQLLGREGRPRPKTHRFPYTGLIRCQVCGASITAAHKIKRQLNGNVHEYTYYYCTGRVDPSCTQRKSALKVEDLETQILDFLKKVEVPKLFHSWAIDTLKAMHESERHDRTKLLSKKQARYAEIMLKLDTLLDLLIDETITKETYDTKKAELERERSNLKVFLDNIDERVGAWLRKVEGAIDFAADARKEFETGDMEKKRLILSTIGCNHLLKDKRLIFQAEKPLLIVQEAVSEAKTISHRLEPPKNKALQRRILESYSQNPTLCPGEDLNLHVLRHMHLKHTCLPITPPGQVKILYHYFCFFFSDGCRFFGCLSFYLCDYFCFSRGNSLVALQMQHARIPELATNRLRSYFTDEVELRATDFRTLHDLYRVDRGGIKRECLFNANAGHDRTDGKHRPTLGAMLRREH